MLPESGSHKLQSVEWYRREELELGAHWMGPAVVAEYSGTTVVPAGWRGEIDGFGAMVLTRLGGGE